MTHDVVVPDVVGPIEGYRVFDMTKNLRLRAVNAEYGYWEPGPNEARCMTTPRFARRNGADGLEVVPVDDGHGRIPEPRCNCGFWVLKTPRDVLNRSLLGPLAAYGTTMQAFARAMLSGLPATRVLDSGGVARVPAKVRAWGRVIVAEDGYRAEIAEVETLYLAGSEDELLRRQIVDTAERYGIPVVQSDLWEPPDPLGLGEIQTAFAGPGPMPRHVRRMNEGEEPSPDGPPTKREPMHVKGIERLRRAFEKDSRFWRNQVRSR